VRKLTAILGFIDALNDRVGRALSYAVLAMFVLVLSEVIRRYFFNAPTVWGNELTQLIFGMYVILSGGHVMRWGGHVNVDILYSRISTRTKAVVDIFTCSLFFLFSGMMLIYGGSLALESLSILERSNSAWEVPLYPWKMMIPIGALLLLLQGIAKVVRDILTVATGTELKPGETGERETL